jgi:hypothetical protein
MARSGLHTGGGKWDSAMATVFVAAVNPLDSSSYLAIKPPGRETIGRQRR